MSNLREVPTDELLSFQDFTPVHNPIDIRTTTIPITIDPPDQHDDLEKLQKDNRDTDPLETNTSEDLKSFWTLRYYQRFFDVDTSDVIERLLASIIPRRNSVFGNKIKVKPDLYGPFWISVTLIFTIAISGNVTNYLQHANAQYHWKYDFHLVSYAATTIVLYVSLVPLSFWGVLRWSAESLDDGALSSPLELICIYGYSLAIYIPVSILWSIQVSWFQWLLVLIAALLSGSVLVYTLLPTLSQSRHKFFLMLGVITCHLLLAVGFKCYFFHEPASAIVEAFIPHGNKTTV